MSQKLPLPTITQMRAALALKLARRPVSMTRRGVLKAGGKWSARKVAAARAETLRALA